ncbi:MAG: CCA tRNA nucleotidyltransferase [Candidatus Korobacteraceae bacterium]|jgi:tRNA nucleotidyltransferase/poly(A) polymerase
MADYIYTMEIRLAPDQLKVVSLVQEAARAHGMNVYLTGGAIRDILTGLSIRDLDFSVQGNALKLQKDLERAGAKVEVISEETKTLHAVLPGGVRVEISMARSETYGKPGAPPQIAPATINEDLRRRDFTVNAIALSLNPGSRGLLLDPFNGSADVEAKLIRVLHNYAFLEDPSRLIRATRFAARFHWELEERTKARYDAAKENSYIEYISRKNIGYEIEQIAFEDNPLHIMQALEKEGWLKVLHPQWSTAKVDQNEMSQWMKTRQLLQDMGHTIDAAPLAFYFLTKRMGDKDLAEIQRLIPHKEFVAAWQAVEENGKELAKKLSGKDASTPSRAWRVLSSAKPEAILFLDVTSRQQAVSEKIKNYFGKWRQMQQKLPLVEMAEMRITPQLAEYPKIAEEAFLLLLDGKLRNHSEIVKFLKPYEPPLPPPPPPPRRRGAKAAAVKVAVTGQADSAAAPKRGRKPKEAVAPGAPVEVIAAAAGETPKKVAAKPAAGEAPKKVAAKPAAAGEVPKKVAAKPMAKPQAEKAKTKVTKPAPAKKAQPQPVKKIAKPQPAKKVAKKKPVPAKPAAKKTPAAKKPAKAPAKKPAKRK